MTDPQTLRDAFRRKRYGPGEYDPDFDLFDAAADEIERLRRVNEVQRECLKIAYDTLSDKNLRLINIRVVLDADKFFIDGQSTSKELG